VPAYWLTYRGQDVHVEKMPELPAIAECHGRPVVIKGTLNRMPVLHLDPSLGDALLEQYRVDNASMEPLKALLLPEIQVAE
jgi:hypothetical protein